jgi:hypothetical protein
MSQKMHDPVTFLRNLVSKKGKSDLYGVYLTAVNVIADSQLEYGYEVPEEDVKRNLKNLFSGEKADWNQLLVDTRVDESEIVHPIAFLHCGEPVTVFFITEGHDMSCSISVPKLNVEEFQYDVFFFQALLKKVASFAGKSATTVRFLIGAASLDWEHLVERGEAEEVTVGF